MNVFKLSLIAVAIAGLSACSLEGDDGQDGVDGAAGADGSNGVSSLTVQTELAVGDANCPNSGVRIDSGLDNDSDGTLAEAEITSTSFVCVPGVDSVGSSEILTSLNNDWFVDGQAEVENNKSVWMNATSGNAASSSSVSVATVSSQQELDAMVQNLRGTAKNVILFVGDGMGISTVTAARILDGQMKGLEGEENQLSFDAFPFSGLSKTYNVDAQTPDSAGTMTAMMSGIKTDVGVIGVDEDIELSLIHI